MPNNKQTSKKVASKAAKILKDSKSTKSEKSVAASALAQTKSKGKKYILGINARNTERKIF
jgi:hypothetical protein